MTRPAFVLATANKDKAAEIEAILGSQVELLPRPGDVGEVDETGATLEDNARLKARSLVDATGLPAIADDTGLEVDDLAGRPGVRSARYAGDNATYADNVAKLLLEIGSTPQRAARFRTVVVALWPDGREIVAEGVAAGSIATEIRGSQGFGYDCVFVPDDGDGRTFAEMGSPEKNALSHRGRALRALQARMSAEAIFTADSTDAAGSSPGVEVIPTLKRKRRGISHILPRPVWQVGRLLIVALLIEYLVVPQLAGPRKVIHLISEVNPLLLLAGVGLEAAAILAYGRLTASILPSASRLRFWTIVRIEVTTLSVSHCTPGGSAAGTALGYRLMTQSGVQSGDAGFVLGAQGIGSAVVLNVILWVALIVSIPVWGFSALYLLAAGVGVVLLGLSAALVYALTKGEQRVGELIERLALKAPFINATALRKAFGNLATRLAVFGEHRDVMGRALMWASLNWLLDAGSLFVFVGAFGHWVNPDGLLVAYGLANVLAVIPVTPGGLGVIEATLTTLLVGFGTQRGVATLGVLVYRLFNFWAPIPLGGITYLSLQVDKPGPDGSKPWPIRTFRRLVRAQHHSGRDPEPRREMANATKAESGAVDPLT
ncbi:MAG: RdgB/HAM1 family non-canonical purine NTP pyrophosphatase [Acidimicrobiales bacterium]